MEGYKDKYVTQAIEYLDYLVWQTNSNFKELKNVYDSKQPLEADELYHDMAIVEAHAADLLSNLVKFRNHMSVVLEGDEKDAKGDRHYQKGLG